ncbi:DoxX family protein [Mycolicibacterium sp. J2]|uniref:DoxX family protein n=1 Tax=Mycolicibacterium sp. J2 TaxID=2993511 RepID=UPI00224B6CCA|nr:DoxX family protein [Mycolicibacterium sp. J2]MCX2712260.1 DoxX family protein [Mycolicibacterium sp. J2]
MTEPVAQWRPLTRIAFRFCFLYFGLFCLWFAQITFVFTGPLAVLLPAGAVQWQMLWTDPATRWVGRLLFGVDTRLHPGSGSGDQAAIWVAMFCLLVIAVLGTVVWSLLDRRRSGYPALAGWFRVFLRLCLGGQMLFYGAAKVIPTQMPEPPLSALLQPFGQFSPASVLWLQVGSSPVYEMALGAVEMVAGLLLFLPRTATFGALLSLLSMAQVVLLNMTFDVPVKILSSQLLLISAVLLAPQARRLFAAVVLERACEPVPVPRLFTGARANRWAVRVQLALGIWVLAGLLIQGWQAWESYGGGRPKPELYGIWSVRSFTLDGRVVEPLTTDENRWQRLVFDEVGAVTFQSMDGMLHTALAAMDPGSATLTLTTPLPTPDGNTAPVPDPTPFANLHVQRPDADRLTLAGTLRGAPVHIELDRVDPDTFPLRNRGFHWVQEYPYFR